jgi:hypothetical protein
MADVIQFCRYCGKAVKGALVFAARVGDHPPPRDEAQKPIPLSYRFECPGPDQHPDGEPALWFWTAPTWGREPD